MKLVVVESPAKAQTINRYLGKDYKVLASIGHIRDLPSKEGAVLPNEGFKMIWGLTKDKEKVINNIVKELKDYQIKFDIVDPCVDQAEVYDLYSLRVSTKFITNSIVQFNKPRCLF